MEDWEASITALAQPQQTPRDNPRIQKVPHYLRNIASNTKCYNPVLVSLGPLHRSNPELLPMEQVKAQFMQKFAIESKVSFQEIYDQVDSVLNEVKDCYVSSALDGLTDTEFCQMMCLDGCFILQFLIMISQRVSNVMNINHMVLVLRDLFLLENQIPFIVLRSLMNLRDDTENELVKILTTLMDLESETRHSAEDLKNPLNSIITNQCPAHLLSLSCSMFSDDGTYIESKITPSTEMISYRSATELRTAGIRFCRSRDRHVDRIKFDSYCCWGRLQLPPLTVHSRTKSKLLNLAAYEACPNGSDKLQVTSYICFMDELIDQAGDVTLLRSEGVLFNHLGCDQKVSDLFNDIANGLVPNTFKYINTRMGIEAHYKNKFYIWSAHLMHTYLASPWKAVGLVAAIIVIILTSMQAWFAAFPRSTK